MMSAQLTEGSWDMGWTDGALVGLGFAASSRNPEHIPEPQNYPEQAPESQRR